jgi:hypothetical protein
VKQRVKKRYIAIFVILGLLALVYFPISSYNKTLRLYYKFHSAINPDTDVIFKGVKSDFFYAPDEYNETSRLFYLCKIWGFVRGKVEGIRDIDTRYTVE